MAKPITASPVNTVLFKQEWGPEPAPLFGSQLELIAHLPRRPGGGGWTAGSISKPLAGSESCPLALQEAVIDAALRRSRKIPLEAGEAARMREALASAFAKLATMPRDPAEELFRRLPSATLVCIFVAAQEDLTWGLLSESRFLLRLGAALASDEGTCTRYRFFFPYEGKEDGRGKMLGTLLWSRLQDVVRAGQQFRNPTGEARPLDRLEFLCGESSATDATFARGGAKQAAVSRLRTASTAIARPRLRVVGIPEARFRSHDYTRPLVVINPGSKVVGDGSLAFRQETNTDLPKLSLLRPDMLEAWEHSVWRGIVANPPPQCSVRSFRKIIDRLGEWELEPSMTID